jgi:phosphoribosylpyrophosphate synthetase
VCDIYMDRMSFIHGGPKIFVEPLAIQYIPTNSHLNDMVMVSPDAGGA